MKYQYALTGKTWTNVVEQKQLNKDNLIGTAEVAESSNRQSNKRPVALPTRTVRPAQQINMATGSFARGACPNASHLTSVPPGGGTEGGWHNIIFVKYQLILA